MPHHHPTVVLINDELRLLRLMADAIQDAGFKVAAFERGDRALDDPVIAEAQVIVADWTNQPKGMELWQALRASKNPAQVVFVSPHADDIAELFATAEVKPAAIIGPFIVRNVVATVKALLGEAAA